MHTPTPMHTPPPNPPLTWYLTTIRGDIKLVSKGDKRTVLTAKELSPTERLAVDELRRTATGIFRNWASRQDFERAMSSHEAGDELCIELGAPVEHVQAVLSRMLKPGRRLLSVAIVGERLEEVWRSDPEVVPPKPETPYRDMPPDAKPAPADTKPDAEPKPEPPPKADAPPKPPPAEAKKATTVAQPTRGCPAPDFVEGPAERANRVLEVFLSVDQIKDYKRYGAFISKGFDSGRRYALTSRDARAELRQRGGRTLHDIDINRSYCVHDWDVPPAEELLALHAFLSVPGGETYLIAIPQ